MKSVKKTDRILALVLSFLMIVSMMPTSLFAASGEKTAVKSITSVEELLKGVPAGETYELGTDLVLTEGQQIGNIEGVLDGKGHTITLADKPMTNLITGTVQNLGVKGDTDITNPGTASQFGTIAVILDGGKVLNSFSTAPMKSGLDDVGGLVGNSIGGTIANSFYAGKVSGMMVGGLIGASINGDKPSVIRYGYYTAGDLPVSMGTYYNKPDGLFAKKSIEEMKEADFAELLNTEIEDTGYIWKAVEGELPVLVSTAPAGTVIRQENIEMLFSGVPEDETWELGEDLTLSEGQMLGTIAGVLDGKGHTITLADKPMTNMITGTVQNLGVKGDTVIKNPQAYGSFGTMAVNMEGGKILNSFSTAPLKSSFDDAGGLVGTSFGGTIANSFYGGKISGGLFGGLIGSSADPERPSVLRYAYFTDGEGPVSVGTHYNKPDGLFAKKTIEEMKEADFADLLNTEIEDTGFKWTAVPENLPVLKASDSSEPEVVNKDALNNKIAEVKELDEKAYTEASWKTVKTALEAAEKTAAAPEASQKDVNSALKALKEAVENLEKKQVIKPVAIPEDSDLVVEVTDPSQLRKTEAGKFYVLKNDITVEKKVTTDFSGVLDGQGHTITLKGSPFVQTVTADGVIQNVHFEGTVNVEGEGPLGRYLRGSVINTSSAIEGTQCVGLVKRIDNGIVSNCIAYGKAGKGPLVLQYGENPNDFNTYRGKFYSTYWLKSKGDNNPVINEEDLLEGSKAMKDTEMKTKETVSLLNKNKGEAGTTWGQNGVTGLPYFGEDQNYDPDKIALPDSLYPVKFGKDAESAELIQDKRLDVSTNDLDGTNIIGQFFIEGVKPEEVSWKAVDVTDDAMGINLKNGKLTLWGDGEATIIGSVNGVESVWVKVISSNKTIEDIRLFFGEEDVTGGEYTLQGSEWGNLQVKAKYEGEEGYRKLYGKAVNYSYSGSIVHHSGGAEFYFTQPGTAEATVSLKSNPSISKTVKLTSEFVPIESIRADLAPVNVIHARASMGNGYQYDAIENNGVVISPANASNKKGFNVTSSNPAVVTFSPTLPLGYFPFGEGEAELTATIVDKDPTSDYEKTVTGKSTVKFELKNHLTEVTANTKEVTLKEFEKAPLDLTFKGELSDSSVTEPGLEWTFEGDGEVEIGREKLTEQIRPENYPEYTADYGYWMASTNYTVTGVTAGTVVATGTPVDSKNGVKPVTITIHVEQGDAPAVDISELVEKGRRAAIKYIVNQNSDNNYTYGSEWNVYGLLRTGQQIPEESLENYYKSVAEEVKGWAASSKATKPTDIERTILALNAMGKDISDVEGVDLVDLLLNNPDITKGTNEFAFALIALDSGKTPDRKDAKWNRDNLVKELLTWQNSDGGYPLTFKGSSGIDTTAMVLQGLAPYQNQPEVRESIEKGLKYMSEKIGKKFDAGTSEANAQIIIALSVLGRDPLTEPGYFSKVNNMITSLMDYCVDGNGFTHTKDLGKANDMATIQALQALDAYKMFRDADASYWDTTIEITPEGPVKPDVPPVPGPDDQGKPITVKFTLLGDKVHDSDKDHIIHTDAYGNLETWIPETEVETTEGATVKDVFVKVLTENNFEWKERFNGAYVSEINGLAEFTNGQNSGWMYKVNGIHPEVSFADQELAEGDVIVFHYTDDYTKERDGARIELADGSAALTHRDFVKVEGGYKITAKGKHINARPEVKDPAGNVLEEGRDYELSYSSEKRVNPGKYTVNIKGTGKYTGELSIDFIIVPEKPENAGGRLSKLEGGYDDAVITWNEVEGASGYSVKYRKAGESKWSKSTRTTRTKLVKENLNDGYTYEFNIKPYYTSEGIRYMSTESETVKVTTLKKVNLKSAVKAGKGKVTLKWDNIAGERGYQISKSTKKDGAKAVKTYRTSKGKSITIDAKAGTGYYYKVRAYQVVDGKMIYAPWSKAKYCKVR